MEHRDYKVRAAAWMQYSWSCNIWWNKSQMEDNLGHVKAAKWMQMLPKRPCPDDEDHCDYKVPINMNRFLDDIKDPTKMHCSPTPQRREEVMAVAGAPRNTSANNEAAARQSLKAATFLSLQEHR